MREWGAHRQWRALLQTHPGIQTQPGSGLLQCRTLLCPYGFSTDFGSFSIVKWDFCFHSNLTEKDVVLYDGTYRGQSLVYNPMSHNFTAGLKDMSKNCPRFSPICFF